MEQGPSGLNPELRTPPLPATHVRAGTGHRVLARNYTTDKVGPPTCEFTRDVRPRVATSSGSSPPPTWPNSWTDSTDTNKPRHPRAPNPRPPDPRWTYKPDHLGRESHLLRRRVAGWVTRIVQQYLSADDRRDVSLPIKPEAFLLRRRLQLVGVGGG